MSWLFWWRRKQQPAMPFKMEADPNGISRLAVQGLSSLAQLLELFGAHAFDIEEGDSRRLKHQSILWAYHVLTGSPHKSRSGSDPTPSLPLPGAQLNQRERDWPALEKFIRVRRKAEREGFESNSDALKSVVWELVHGLRSMSNGGHSTESKIQKGLENLETALETQSVEKLQKAIKPVVANIRSALDEQRKQFDTELSSMTSLVSKMRRELVATRRDAEIDPLTQLYNRRAFDSALARHVDLADLSARELTLMMIDLDHFKAVNDCYGHPAGDALLSAAANELTRALPRKSDFLARFGGEEFAVIIFDAPEDSAAKLAQTVLNRIQNMTLEHEDHSIQITCSIGYASLNPEESAISLLKRADQALYAAKDQGRNCTVKA